MVIDEWGTWMAVEPGTNPGFLYQQNSLRDALSAALHFHIFHRHANRISMANIAQTINVLQAMILTDGPRMLRTPTYWVFEMFKAHQGGTTVPVVLESDDYTFEATSIPAVSGSVTTSDATYVSLVNTDPNRSATVTVGLTGVAFAEGRVLVGDSITAYNTFDAPDHVSPQPFTAIAESDGGYLVELPPASVAILTFR
jgi:alpha-N-arabinofuranosidase